MIFGSDENVQGIIYAIGMDITITDLNIIAPSLLHIIKKLLTIKKPPRLYIFTSGVHGINPDVNFTDNISTATLFGMVKTLKNENSEMFVRYVDFDRATLNDEMLTEQIFYEFALSKDSKEKERVQIAYWDGQRYQPKLIKCVVSGNQGINDELRLPSYCNRYQLILPKSGTIQDLEFDVLGEECVVENEVKVEVYSLNFLDIFTILNPIAQFENLNSIGLDLAGVVTKVGSESSNKLQVGERVFGINFNDNSALKSHIVLKDNHLLRIPSGMTFTEAATLPTVFATSMLYMVNVAVLKAEDTLLIIRVAVESAQVLFRWLESLGLG